MPAAPSPYLCDLSADHHINGPSTWSRRGACPGSAKLEASSPEPPDNPDATHGRLMHAAVADFALRTTLTVADREQLEWLDAELADLQAMHGQPWQFEVKLPIYTSGRWDGQLLCFGTLDAYAVVEEDAYLLDFKFGWIPQDAAIENQQLAGYALAIFQRHPKVRRVHAFLFQPTMRRQVEPYTYTDPASLLSYAKELLAETERPAPIIQAGSHCAHCRAKAHCSAFLLAQAHLGVLPADSPTQMAPLALTPDNARTFYDLIKAAEALLDQRKREVEHYVSTQGGQVGTKGDGLRLAEVQGDRFISDLTRAYAKVSKYLPESAFLACCSLKLDRFERAVIDAMQARGEVKTIAEGKQKLSALMDYQRTPTTTSLKRT